MKQLLEDILYTLNQLPDRKVKGKDFTTYDLAKRVENKLQFFEQKTEQYFSNTTAQNNNE